MVLHEKGQPLVFEEWPDPIPGPGELRVLVEACGVCRTDLHVVDGELPDPSCRSFPGMKSSGASMRSAPERAVSKLARSRHTLAWRDLRRLPLLREPPGKSVRPAGLHRLHTKRRLRDPCDRRRTLLVSLERRRQCRRARAFALRRSYRLALASRFAGTAKPLGLYGFGAAAHIIVQAALKQGRRVFAFTRPGDAASQAFALRLGAAWAGGSGETPPEPLDAAILYAPVGELVPIALAAVGRAASSFVPEFT